MKSYFLIKFETIRLFYIAGVVTTFTAFALSLTFIFSDYLNFRSNIEAAVKEQNHRAKNRFSESLIHTQYITESIANQILIHNSGRKSLDYKFINSLLIGYRNSVNELISWSTFSWADKDQNLVVSSNSGIMKTPVNMSFRDYMPLTKSHPWHVHLGKPVFGAVSKLWSIPAGYGLVDQRGKYIGAVITGMVIEGLNRHVYESISNPRVSFAITDKNGEILTSSAGFNSEKTAKFLRKLKNNLTQNSFAYGDGFYQKIDDYPYGIITFYRYNTIHEQGTTRLSLYIVLSSLIVFFIYFLFTFFYRNLLAPVFELSEFANKISRGEKLSHPIPRYTISEINDLAEIIRDVAKKNK